jgi:hypothetical protein
MELITPQSIESKILVVRCIQVILDKNLDKKWFTFSRIDAILPQILEKLD